jgi:hypothetical protein
MLLQKISYCTRFIDSESIDRRIHISNRRVETQFEALSVQIVMWKAIQNVLDGSAGQESRRLSSLRVRKPCLPDTSRLGISEC